MSLLENELEIKRNQIENLLMNVRNLDQRLKETQEQCFCHERIVEVH